MNTSMLLDTRHSSKVGFLSMFVYGQNLAEQNNSVFEPAIIGDASSLMQSLNILGLNAVKPIFYQEKSRQVAASTIENLIQSGYLDIKMREMLSCDCGKIKIPSEAVLRNTSSSLVSGNTSICCGSNLSKAHESVIQTKPIEFCDDNIISYPSWGKHEITNMKDNFKGKCLVLSRNRETGISISVDGNHFFIDNDMFVYLSPVINNIPPTNIITGTSLVKQFTLSTYFTSLLKVNIKNLDIHFLPRVNYKGDRDILNLCQKFGQNRVRTKLLSLAKSEKQVIEFNDSGI